MVRIRYVAAALLVAALALIALPTPAGADMGPKPSVVVEVSGLGGQQCYATLLSADESTGPSSAWNGSDQDARYGEGGREVWQAFVDYEDPDGYYFLQEYWDLQGAGGTLAWTYYPPSPFKLLLYFPETGTFVSSGACERYAFDSTFRADASRARETGGLELARSAHVGVTLVSLLVRMAVTCALELLVAYAFGYRAPRALLVIVTANVATQLLLRLLVGGQYTGGLLGFADYANSLLVGEAIVVAVESLTYATQLPQLAGKGSGRRQGRLHAVAYAVVANLVSFVGGLALTWAGVYPGYLI